MRLAVRVGALCALGLWLASVQVRAQSNEDVESEWDSLLLLQSEPPPGPIESADSKAEGGKTARAERKKKPSRKKRSSSAGYGQLRDAWHSVIEDGSFGDTTGGFVPLVLRNAGHGEPLILTPDREDGGFDEGELSFASQYMGSWPKGPDVHPHLLDLIYRAVIHFDVRYVTVVSGVRRDRKGSRHSHGLAADVVLPGIKDEDLAAYFRAQGFVGVGLYVNAGFVHVDVRERSYFWLDRSAPGSRRSRQTQVHADEAKAMDEAAIARGEAPHVNPEPLNRVLRARAQRRNQRDKKAVSEKRRPKRDAAPKRETSVKKKPEAAEAAPKPEAAAAPPSEVPAAAPDKTK